MRSYYSHPSPYANLAAPLNKLRGELQHDQAEALAKKVFHSVAEELEENYPGGCQRAEEELKAWLMQSN